MGRRLKHEWSNFESQTDIQWMEAFERMSGFNAFISVCTIQLRCHNAQSYLDNDIPKAEITDASYPDSFSTPNKPWNVEQIVYSPGDSIGILVFPNGDYAGI